MLVWLLVSLLGTVRGGPGSQQAPWITLHPGIQVKSLGSGCQNSRYLGAVQRYHSLTVRFEKI